MSARPSVRASAGLASVLSSRALSERNDAIVRVSSAVGPVRVSLSTAMVFWVALSVACSASSVA